MMPMKKEENYESGFPKKVCRNKYNLPINERLKIARNKKGYSLSKAITELSERGVKMGLSTLQGYEAHEESLNHRYPSVSMLYALAELYDCSIDFLFGRIEKIELKSSKKISL